jgi:protein tyrosine phosphatase (PTP) superfamily phosphohydrolase (DUF442 family)
VPVDELHRIHAFAELSPAIATAGQPTAEQLGLIADAGFDVVINLARDDSPRAIPEERALVEARGLAYVHLPIDFPAPEVEQALALFDELRRRVAQRVFVHCAANMRVSALMRVYRTVCLGVSEADADADLLEIWTPNEVWQSYMQAVEGALRASLTS